MLSGNKFFERWRAGSVREILTSDGACNVRMMSSRKPRISTRSRMCESFVCQTNCQAKTIGGLDHAPAALCNTSRAPNGKFQTGSFRRGARGVLVREVRWQDFRILLNVRLRKLEKQLGQQTKAQVILALINPAALPALQSPRHFSSSSICYSAPYVSQSSPSF